MRALLGVQAGVAAVSTVLALLAAPALAAPTPTTTLATGDAAGGPLASTSGQIEATMTPDGRYVVFLSNAAAIGAGAEDGPRRVFRKDRRTGAVIRIDVPDPGRGGAIDGPSSRPTISDDGNRVAFESASGRLVAADNNDGADVFVRDVAAGTTTRADVRVDGTPVTVNQGTGQDTLRPMISGDGTTVTWLALERAMTSSSLTLTHVWARRLDQTGADRIDAATDGGASTGSATPSTAPSISGDGRLVVFASGATNLVAGDANAHWDVFVRDRRLQTTKMVSLSSGGTQGTGDADDPAISEDGTVVAFQSSAPNLVAGDTNGVNDIFARDLGSGQTSRVSVKQNGDEATYGSIGPVVSADGRFVAFLTPAALLGSDSEATPGNDVYMADRDTGALTRASVVTDGSPSVSTAATNALAISATGRFVLFDSLGAFAPNDTNGRGDAYLRDNALNSAPTSVPRVTATPGDLVVQVDGTGSTDPDGWVDGYSWSFGDGTTAAGPTGPHRYAQAGRYSVVLTVTDNDGATSTQTTTVDVTAPPPAPGVAPPPAFVPPSGEPLVVAKPKAPRNIKKPALSTDKKDPKLLRCSAGTWEGKPKYGYRWLRDGKAIKHATTSKHRIAKADAGHRVSCRVTATIAGRPAGTATSASRKIPSAKKKKTSNQRKKG
jgi:Tol biopolymer transport system component